MPVQAMDFFKISKHTQKIIFHNPFDINVIEFHTRTEHFCMEILHKGTSVLCLCNPHWRTNIAKRDFRVSLKFSEENRNTYFLRKIEHPFPSTFVFFRIERQDLTLSSEYACILQVRQHFYRTPNTQHVPSTPEYLPLAVRELIANDTYLLRTQFYNKKGRYDTCVNPNPLTTHW